MTATTEARGRHTPRRSVRVPEDIWRAAIQRAGEEGTTISARVVAFLVAYGQPEDHAN